MSVFHDILVGVQSVVLAFDVHNTVVIRKRPVVGYDDRAKLSPALSAFPFFAVISPGRERIKQLTTENVALVEYEVYVTLVRPGDGDLEDNTAEILLSAREGIRQALHKPSLSGASTVIDSDVDPEPAFLPFGLDAGYDYSILLFRFLSQENRSA